MKEGRHEILSDELFALVQGYETRPKEEGTFEAHNRYIDVQYVKEGNEAVYWAMRDTLEVDEDLSDKVDIVFYHTKKATSMVEMRQGFFVLFFRDEAHMPGVSLGKKEKVKKIVCKIKEEIKK